VYVFERVWCGCGWVGWGGVGWGGVGWGGVGWGGVGWGWGGGGVQMHCQVGARNSSMIGGIYVHRSLSWQQQVYQKQAGQGRELLYQ
jgi:hypothetical protein